VFRDDNIMSGSTVVLLTNIYANKQM